MLKGIKRSLLFLLIFVPTFSFASQYFTINNKDYYLSHIYLPAEQNFLFNKSFSKTNSENEAPEPYKTQVQSVHIAHEDKQYQAILLPAELKQAGTKTQTFHIFIKQTNIFNQTEGIYKFLGEHLTVQENLLSLGQAVFYPQTSINSFWYQALLNAEQIARSNKQGLWQQAKLEENSYYLHVSHNFLILTGKIQKISLYQGHYYINLDKNIFNNLVIMMPKNFLKNLNIRFKDFSSLVNKRVEVRGWGTKTKTNKIYITPSNPLMVRLLEQ
ncbi:hypothetical protein [Rickettsiales endosymbiont of Stachyamoeba lipophora]|uniref:hypothetical protein n=1 Tax=Rickettsiales endosymbiont of Stachyamoeba lipophora TaxID=2486578 RepID=UPI000F64D3F0|nr:hypothetical protein [Rickettsiales endosymbiont of Stachyamoeba lipophora]AZL15592.1 hypothetical protein EF513_03380 [Rickettsiales endosymbiont of Stachyamoeba lipophora]